MRSVRRHLAWATAAWLLCQAAGVVAPVVFASGSASAEEICACPGGDHGAACPMHHRQAPKSDDRGRCQLQNAAGPQDATLFSLAGGIGILPGTAAFGVLTPFVAAVAAVAIDPVSQSRVPDPPPPRA